MQFNSLYFILFFLPVTILAYYLVGGKSHKAADWVLIGASLVFYGAADVWYPVMLCALIALNWGITRQIRRAGSAGPGAPAARAEEHSPHAQAARTGEDARMQKPGERGLSARSWMILGIVLNAGFLGVFKYTDFFLENLNALFRSDWAAAGLILPLGISFIIFGQIAWIVDVFRGQRLTCPAETESAETEKPAAGGADRTSAANRPLSENGLSDGGEEGTVAGASFREYALYSVFFPKLTQGPITLPRDFLPQLRRDGRHAPDWDDLAVGIQMFVCGLGKKVLIADVLGVGVEFYFETISYRSNIESLIVLLAYTFQIYMDFSGYSDMALGVSRMLGFRLPANFRSPYKACTVTDFWRRWHISLTTFLREYIYFPLGGSRKGTARTILNILIVYLISGLWHGASWSFVLWGLFHGLAQVIERLLGTRYLRVWKPLRWLITFGFAGTMWMLFYCGNWASFSRFWWHLTVRYDMVWQLSSEFLETFKIPGVAGALGLLGLPSGQSAAGLVSLLLLLALCFFLCLACPNNQERRYRNSAATVLLTAGLLCLCLLSMNGVSTFIYNDF